MKFNPGGSVGAVAVGVGMIGLAAYGVSRAGILDFLQHKSADTAQADAPRTVAEPVDTASAVAPAPGQTPNYRQIVRKWGPAVVGVTVEGTRKIGLDSSSGLDGRDR